MNAPLFPCDTCGEFAPWGNCDAHGPPAPQHATPADLAPRNFELRILRRVWTEVAPGQWAADPNRRYCQRSEDVLQYRTGPLSEWCDVPVVVEQRG